MLQTAETTRPDSLPAPDVVEGEKQTMAADARRSFYWYRRLIRPNE